MNHSSAPHRRSRLDIPAPAADTTARAAVDRFAASPLPARAQTRKPITFDAAI